MSKYALKLEQLVQTDAYGEILITIQYDGQGPKLVSANGDGLDPELKHALDTILGLVNFALAKEISPAEIAEQLETEPQDGVHLPLNDVLLVVASSLKEAPNGIGEINPGILMEVAPEMVKKFTESVGSSLPPSDGGDPSYDQPATDQYGQPQNQQAQGKQSDETENSEKGGFFGGFNNKKS